MTKNTRTAIVAILATDSTIPQETADAALKVLDGKGSPAVAPARLRWLELTDRPRFHKED